jgi:glycosyltransferase involved in cell wall biosynthesis
MRKLSIITPSYNQGQFIEDCLLSVKRQNYPGGMEHLVLDGGSTDDTVQILKRYSSQPGWEHLKWISEPDGGQSDALNKGFRMATGDIIGWLNSDDLYAENCLATVARFFDDHGPVDVCYGDYTWIDEKGGILQIRREIEYSHFLLLYNRVCFVQSSAALFVSRRIFDEGNFLDPKYHYAMDYEFYLRLASKGYIFKRIPSILGAFRWHVDSKTCTNASKQCEEIERARELYAPALGRIERPWCRVVVLAALKAVATILRWSEKGMRGHYFQQFRPAPENNRVR